MFKFFKKKCVICKMELDENKDYQEIGGKKVCSDKCREEYRQVLIKEEAKSNSRSCCG